MKTTGVDALWVSAGAVLLVLGGWLLWTLVLRGFFRSSSCPRCGATKVRPSVLREWTDSLFSVLSLAPYRCLSCGLRYYTIHRSKPPVAHPQRELRELPAEGGSGQVQKSPVELRRLTPPRIRVVVRASAGWRKALTKASRPPDRASKK